MVIEFPRSQRRTPVEDHLDARLAERERQLEIELEEIRRVRENVRAIRAANSTRDSAVLPTQHKS